MLSRRNFLKLAGLGGAGLALGLKPSAWPTGSRLRITVTGRSFSPAVLTAFTDATGALVDVDFLDDRDDGNTLAAYDLAVVPAHTLTGLIRDNLVRELGPITLPSALEQRAYDPLDAFSLPAARGAVGINARGIGPPSSWAEFFDLARIVPAHLPFADSFGAALKSMGHSINTRNTLARNQARALLTGLGSVPLPGARLAVGPPIPGWAFAVPAEGAERWEDCFCIPLGSPQPDLARSLIRFAVSHHPPAPLPDTLRALEPRSPFAPPLV